MGRILKIMKSKHRNSARMMQRSLNRYSLGGNQPILFKYYWHYNPGLLHRQAREDSRGELTPIIHGTENLGLLFSIRTHIRIAWGKQPGTRLRPTLNQSLPMDQMVLLLPPSYPTSLLCMCTCVSSGVEGETRNLSCFL